MLIDTNIFIEIGRDQEASQACDDLLSAIACSGAAAYITRFSLHAIQSLLSEKAPQLLREIMILVHGERLKVYDFHPEDYMMIIATKDSLNLDFDDCLQFTAAHRLSVPLVTLDKDFKKTPLETLSPKQALKHFVVQT